MGFMDKARGRLTGLVDRHGDKLAGGIDKAATTLDQRTKGKYAGQIRKGSAKAKDALDRLDGKNDDIR